MFVRSCEIRVIHLTMYNTLHNNRKNHMLQKMPYLDPRIVSALISRKITAIDLAYSTQNNEGNNGYYQQPLSTIPDGLF